MAAHRNAPDGTHSKGHPPENVRPPGMSPPGVNGGDDMGEDDTGRTSTRHQSIRRQLALMQPAGGHGDDSIKCRPEGRRMKAL